MNKLIRRGSLSDSASPPCPNTSATSNFKLGLGHLSRHPLFKHLLFVPFESGYPTLVPFPLLRSGSLLFAKLLYLPYGGLNGHEPKEKCSEPLKFKLLFGTLLQTQTEKSAPLDKALRALVPTMFLTITVVRESSPRWILAGENEPWITRARP